MAQSVLHRYYLVNRPDVQPDGFTAHEVWYPERTAPDIPNVMVYGWADYAVSLDQETVWRYELLPADPVERARYDFYLYGDRDTVLAHAYLSDYLEQTVDQLNLLVEKRHDHMAAAALVLKEVKPCLPC